MGPTVDDLERRRRNIRLILLTIILITLPFYCVGIVLWGTAPQRPAQAITPAATLPAQLSPTPLVVTATLPGEPSITPLPITVDFGTVLPPTSFLPVTPSPAILPTRFISPTPPVILPTAAPLATDTPPGPPPIPVDFTPLPFDTVAP